MKNSVSGMSLIVKTVTRLTVGLILAYAVYIVFQGHSGPGGGFAGGIIIALAFIHLMLAYGKDGVIKIINEERGLVLASLAGIAFLCFSVMGFSHALPVLLYEAALAILVGTGVFVIFVALVELIAERSK